MNSKSRKRKVAGKDAKPSSKPKPSKLALKAAIEVKERLLAELELLGARLPTNTLDQLIDEFGGPDKVAEMTGRKGRVVQDCNGRVQYESREEDEVNLEDLNREEKERFMNGEKDVAIISEAASSGISLQVNFQNIVYMNALCHFLTSRRLIVVLSINVVAST